MFLLFEFVDEIRNCGHSNGSYWAVRSRHVVYYTLQDAHDLMTIEMKATEELYFPVVMFLTLYRVLCHFVCKWNLKQWPCQWKRLSRLVGVYVDYVDERNWFFPTAILEKLERTHSSNYAFTIVRKIKLCELFWRESNQQTSVLRLQSMMCSYATIRIRSWAL